MKGSFIALVHLCILLSSDSYRWLVKHPQFCGNSAGKLYATSMRRPQQQRGPPPDLSSRNDDSDTAKDVKSTNSASFFYSQKKLKDLGLTEKMISVLTSMQITKPSKVQALSFNTIYSGKNVILGDQTGSGKTLAYFLPLIQRVDAKINCGNLTGPRERSPYIVILTPTTELAEYVLILFFFLLSSF